jgi:hypothetical protein
MKAAYAGRQPGIVPKVVNLDRHAVQLLAEMAPTPKSYGAFLTTLIVAEHARRQERRRLRELLREEPDYDTQNSPK